MTSQLHEKKLLRWMRLLGVRTEDLEESFVRSSAPGGQNVNKVASCVYLKHGPSGIAVKCQEFRTQAMNRLAARQILLEKIEAQRRKESQTKIQEAQKLKRQKRKRPAALQERILRAKKIRSEKKVNRRPIRMTSL